MILNTIVCIKGDLKLDDCIDEVTGVVNNVMKCLSATGSDVKGHLLRHNLHNYFNLHVCPSFRRPVPSRPVTLSSFITFRVPEAKSDHC